MRALPRCAACCVLLNPPSNSDLISLAHRHSSTQLSTVQTTRSTADLRSGTVGRRRAETRANALIRPYKTTALRRGLGAGAVGHTAKAALICE